MRSYEGEDEEKEEEDVDDEGDDDDGTGGPRVAGRGNVMVECVVGSKGADVMTARGVKVTRWAAGTCKQGGCEGRRREEGVDATRGRR